MKKYILATVLAVVVSMPFFCSVKAEEIENALTIVVSEKIPVFKEGDEISLSDFVSIEGDETARLIAIKEDDLKIAGDHRISLFAIGDDGRFAVSEMHIEVLTDSDYSEYVKKQNAAKRKKKSTVRIADIPKSDDAYSMAQNFVGIKGDCYYIAQQFIYAYLGDYQISSAYNIDASEASAGDIIFYSNGGLGTTHWAVYLGGDSALHGNYNGSARISSVYLNNASEPQFRRVR